MNIKISIAILVLSIITIVVIMILNRKSNKPKISKSKMTANEFVNVKDIKDKYLYTLDGNIMMYIKIKPISVELLSKREKAQLTNKLTAELSSETEPFKFIAVSRPVDIAFVINDLKNIMTTTSNIKQKELIRKEILSMSEYALSGEVVERKFYLIIWDKYKDGVERDILKRCEELAEKFKDCQVETEIIQEREIIRLCNLINNPASVNEEHVFGATIPILDK